jgi:hypothetical protein
MSPINRLKSAIASLDKGNDEKVELKSVVSKEETFEEKVKRSPVEALRELYSSEEYKKYKSLKDTFGGSYVPPAYDLSDEFKAKEKMAWKELDKLMDRDRKKLEEEIKKDPLASLPFDYPRKSKEAEEAFSEKWRKVYAYVYGLIKENPLEENLADNKKNLKGMKEHILGSSTNVKFNGKDFTKEINKDKFLSDVFGLKKVDNNKDVDVKVSNENKNDAGISVRLLRDTKAVIDVKSDKNDLKYAPPSVGGLGM